MCNIFSNHQPYPSRGFRGDFLNEDSKKHVGVGSASVLVKLCEVVLCRLQMTMGDAATELIAGGISSI